MSGNLPFFTRKNCFVGSIAIDIHTFVSQRANYSSIGCFNANSFSSQGSLLMLYVAKARREEGGKWESTIEIKLAWNNVSNPIDDDGSLFEKNIPSSISSCLWVSLHTCAHTKRQKTSEEKSRSDLKCLLVHSSIYAAKREENRNRRQKHKQLHRAGKERIR